MNNLLYYQQTPELAVLGLHVAYYGRRPFCQLHCQQKRALDQPNPSLNFAGQLKLCTNSLHSFCPISIPALSMWHWITRLWFYRLNMPHKFYQIVHENCFSPLRRVCRLRQEPAIRPWNRKFDQNRHWFPKQYWKMVLFKSLTCSSPKMTFLVRVNSIFDLALLSKYRIACYFLARTSLRLDWFYWGCELGDRFLRPAGGTLVVFVWPALELDTGSMHEIPSFWVSLGLEWLALRKLLSFHCLSAHMPLVTYPIN